MYTDNKPLKIKMKSMLFTNAASCGVTQGQLSVSFPVFLLFCLLPPPRSRPTTDPGINVLRTPPSTPS